MFIIEKEALVGINANFTDSKWRLDAVHFEAVALECRNGQVAVPVLERPQARLLDAKHLRTHRLEPGA